MNPNLMAFLDMIAVSEGTAGKGDDGYNVLVGGKLFASYADHPRFYVQLSPTLISSAAGRYQILARYFDAYKKTLGLPDFSPASQDAIAIQMIREQRAYPDVIGGQFEYAVNLCSNIWASLPGANYGQHVNQIADLRRAFTDAGGTLA